MVSLGNHPPTEGYCMGWAGIRIDEGQYGDEDLSGGLNIGLLLEIPPGNMARGNWKAAAYIDDRASDAAFEGLVNIFTGKAKGTTGLFSMLVSDFLGGAERAPITFETEGKKRRLMVGRAIKGEIEPVPGKNGEDQVITNTEYWMGPDITVATANQGRVRAFGRVWDFDGKSAEICQIDWKGPGGR